MTDDQAPYGNDDPRAWADYFVGMARDRPSIATDPETMTTWFANVMGAARDEDRRVREVANAVAAEELTRQVLKIGDDDLLGGRDAYGGALFALDLLACFEHMTQEGWRFIAPDEEA